MREIPELQTLCLRAVASHACSAEKTFAKINGEPSTASRLLRSFHGRSSKKKTSSSNLDQIPMSRTPCIGPGSFRRENANEVDLNHPFVGCRQVLNVDNVTSKDGMLVMQYGNAALDCLQSYIDALVELGRMDDSRLGLHFFEEWKVNVELGKSHTENLAPATKIKKRRRTGGGAASAVVALGSLSLHNCSFGSETIESMVKSKMGQNLAVLDLTGVRSVHDEYCRILFEQSPNIERLSLKNCRKITGNTAERLGNLSRLKCLDIGGCFNVTTVDILNVIPALVHLRELHASGLSWQNESVASLVDIRDNWQALSLGFSPNLTQTSLRESLVQVGDSLRSLAMPFCDKVVDNALLGIIGRNLPFLEYLDLRGNPALTTITGFFDGRTSADLPPLTLTVLARYSSLSENSVEETRRVHPLHTTNKMLTVYLDGGGVGAGVTRTEEKIDVNSAKAN